MKRRDEIILKKLKRRDVRFSAISITRRRPFSRLLDVVAATRAWSTRILKRNCCTLFARKPSRISERLPRYRQGRRARHIPTFSHSLQHWMFSDDYLEQHPTTVHNHLPQWRRRHRPTSMRLWRKLDRVPLVSSGRSGARQIIMYVVLEGG